MKIPFYLITPERVVYQEEADSITLPTVDGEITVLPHHIPLITVLAPGVVVLRSEGVEHFVSVMDGVVKVDKMGLTVLSSSADKATDMVMADVEKALEDAKKLVQEKKVSETELLQAMMLVTRETSRLNALRRHHTRRGGMGSGSENMNS